MKYQSHLLDNKGSRELVNKMEKAIREWEKDHLKDGYSDGYSDYRIDITKWEDEGAVRFTVRGLTKPKAKNRKPKWEEMGPTGSYLARDILSNSYYGLKGKVDYKKSGNSYYLEVI